MPTPNPSPAARRPYGRSSARRRVEGWTPPGSTSPARWTSRRRRSSSDAGRVAGAARRARSARPRVRGLSGVHAIIEAATGRATGRRLVLVRGPPEVDCVFALTRTDEVVEVGDLGPPPEPPASCTSSSPRRRWSREHRRAAAGAAGHVPIEHETSERVVRTLVFGLPARGAAVAGWLAWGGALRWHDLVVLAITYTLSGFGITVGYHRLFTHRSFKTTRAVRALLAVLGSMAVEGPVIEWVRPTASTTATPTSPAIRTARTSTRRRAGAAPCAGSPTPTSAGCSAARTWRTPPATPRTCSPTATCASSAGPSRSGWRSGWPCRSALGLALAGSLVGGLTGLLWGGAVRVLLLHHVTFSINSLCHCFGRRPFATGDESRNLAWLAPSHSARPGTTTTTPSRPRRGTG